MRSDLVAAPLEEVLTAAGLVRARAHGSRVTYSPKVFIPLTRLCRDRCEYCTFATAPARLSAAYLALPEVLAIARAGADAGCHEALFTLGERPEERYPAARQWLAGEGYASTLEYLEAAAVLVRDETGFFFYFNAGALHPDELARLRPGAAQPRCRLRCPARCGDRRLGRGRAAHRRPRQPRPPVAGPRGPPERHRGARLRPRPPPDDLSRVRPRARSLARPRHALPRARPRGRRGARPGRSLGLRRDHRSPSAAPRHAVGHGLDRTGQAAPARPPVR